MFRLLDQELTHIVRQPVSPSQYYLGSPVQFVANPDLLRSQHGSGNATPSTGRMGSVRAVSEPRSKNKSPTPELPAFLVEHNMDYLQTELEEVEKKLMLRALNRGLRELSHKTRFRAVYWKEGRLSMHAVVCGGPKLWTSKLVLRKPFPTMRKNAATKIRNPKTGKLESVRRSPRFEALCTRPCYRYARLNANTYLVSKIKPWDGVSAHKGWLWAK